MRRIVVVCLAAVLVSSAAFGVDYTFVGNKFNETLVYSTTVYASNWDNTLNWSPAGYVTSSTSDSFYIAKNTSGAWLTATTNVGMPNPGGAGNTRYFGSITVDNGNLYVPCSAAGTYRFQADGGQSGSLIITGANARLNRSYSGSKINFVMDGDFIVDPAGATYSGGWWGDTASKSTVTMKGTGVTFRMDSAISRDHSMYLVSVDNYASVNFAAANGGTSNVFHTLELRKGSTASGTVGIVWNGKERLLVGPNANTANLDVRLIPVAAYFTKPIPTTNYYVGEGQLIKGTFRDVEFGPGVGAATSDNAQYTAHLIGALHVRNLAAGNQGTGGASGTSGVAYIIDTDNLLVGSSNLTIDQNLTLGSASPTGWPQHKNGALKANNSQVKVGGNVALKYSTDGGYNVGGYILGGTATFNVGGNWTVDCGTLSGVKWNMGTSTVICDGNGTGNAQILTTKGLPFYDVKISNPGGTVTLADNLVLKGDFGLVAGSFNPASYYVVFKGGFDCETTAQEIDVSNANLKKVRLMAGSSTYAKLISNLTVSDNLDIDTGCKLFLNGFTLDLAGSDAGLFLGQNTLSGAGAWTLKEGGEIVGAGEIPEPGTLLLLGTGVLGVIGYVRRRRLA